MNPALMVALDYSKKAEAEKLADSLAGLPIIMKVGLELFSAEGPAIVSSLRKKGFPIFLDLKLHDIPNTVGKAVAAARDLGVSYLTVHLLGGPAMLQEAQKNVGESLKLLGVSVLTSYDAESWRALIGAIAKEPLDIQSSVEGLVLIAKKAGIAGTVSSAFEVESIRKIYPGAFCVTPGIRLPGEGTHDQARVVTPDLAKKLGSSAIVVGRSITHAVDPRAQAQLILEHLA